MIDDLDQFQPMLEQAGLRIEVAEVRERLSEDELLAYVGNVEGVICGDDMFTDRVLDAAQPKLKVISKWGTGTDSIDQLAAKTMGVKVFNTPNAFTDPVADTVLGFILSFARMIHTSDQQMKSGEWHKLPARALNECVLGIIGVGNIGSAVVHRAQALGMKTVGYDNDETVVSAQVTEMLTLEELLATSDFVSINCDLNSSSRHLMDRATLAMMKPDAILINTARGAVVDEGALIESLRNGGLAGAALDVFESEPLAGDSPLRSMPNVLLSPHNANSGGAVRRAVHKNTINNLFKGLGLEPPNFELLEVYKS